MTPSKGSATPEGGGRPDARTLARRIVLALNDQHRLAGYTEDEVALVIGFVEQDRTARDALHAETFQRQLDEHAYTAGELFKAQDALKVARAALQHGEERERVMREALEVLADRPAAMTVYGPKCTLCYIHGGGHDAACPVRAAADALAAAQAMKEGSG